MDKFFDPLREPQPQTPPPQPPGPDEPDDTVIPPPYPDIHRTRREDVDPGKGILD